MRIVVLDRSPYGNAADARSDALLVATARRLGHDAETRDADRADGDLGGVDVVLPRADLRSPEDLESFAALVLRAESRGVWCFPSSEALVAAEDKRRTGEILQPADIETVPTVIVLCTREGVDLPAARVPPFPVVLKEPVGWGGRGFKVCRDAAELRRAAADVHARRPDGPMLLQAFVRHRRGLTVQVAGGRAVGAFATPARADSGGAVGEFADVAVDETVSATAVHAVAQCRLAFGSVDFADADDGTRPLLEVNSMPGLDPEDAGDRAFAEAIVRSVTGTA